MSILGIRDASILAMQQAQVLGLLATNDNLRQAWQIAIEESIQHFASVNQLSLSQLIDNLKRITIPFSMPFRVEYHYKDEFVFGIRILFQDDNYIIEKYSKDNYLI